MKKRSLWLVAFICMLAASLFACVACGGGDGGHEYGEWTITTPPTMEAGGKASRSCKDGDDTQTVDVPALSDTSFWTVDEVHSTAPTHIADGKTVYTSEYGKVEVTIDAKGHSWGAWSLVKEPTLTEKGTATHACTEDDGGNETKEVPALSDTAVWTEDKTGYKAPTHTEPGKNVYTSEYGRVEVTTAAAGHSWGAWSLVKKPTLTEKGSATRTCTENDGGTETVDVPALSNTAVWKVDATKSQAATHTEPGKNVYTSEYGEVEVTTAATGHSWGKWTLTKEPTLTEQGTATRTCTEDDDGTETVDVPALNNATVWTEDKTQYTAPTHTGTGKAVYTSEYGTVELTVAATGHTWGKWMLTEDPTLTGKGTATRTCTENDGGTETKDDVPELSDASVWTLDKAHSQEATHTAPGTATYTSEYGEVTIDVPTVGDHVWSTTWEWVDGKAPTMEEGTSATTQCTISGCSEKHTESVPALSDEEVWSVDEAQSTKATYNQGGTDVYTSKYGSVEVPTAKLKAPYDGKTYHSFPLDASEELNKALSSDSSWFEASLEVDENGVGYGKAYPFDSNTKIVFSMVDEKTGEIAISFTSKAEGDGDDEYTGETKTRKGYVDFETGCIVMSKEIDTLNYCFVFTPFGEALSTSHIASCWGENALNYAIACTYTYTEGDAEKSISIYIENDVAYFGVTFTGLKEAAVSANACYNAPQLYVKQGEKVIAALGYDGKAMVKLDGLEGDWTSELLGTVTFSGTGTFTAVKDGKEYSGTYAFAEGEDSKLDIQVTMDDVLRYYLAEFTVDGRTLTLTEVNVTIHYNVKGVGDEIGEETVSKNLPHELPKPENDENFFRGWFYDNNCTRPVEETFIPKEDVTLYAKWVKKLTITVSDLTPNKGTETVQVGEGDLVYETLMSLIENTYDAEGCNVFAGWYLLSDAADDGKQWLDESAMQETPFTAAYENPRYTFYAAWDHVPYVGSYYGANLDGVADTDKVSSGSNSSYHIEIAPDGTISGKYTGKVVSYSNQLITWENSSHQTCYFIFDEATGTLATARYNKVTSSSIEEDIAFYSKNGMTSFEHRAIKVPNPASPSSSSQSYYARFVKVTKADESEVIVLLYGSHIYSNITITTSLGEALESIAAIGASNTVIVMDNSVKPAVQILARASEGNALSSGNTKELDSYFGIYQGTDDELKLDGAGVAHLGEHTGRYSAAPDGSEYTLDLYLNNGETEEYYELTLDLTHSSYTMVKAEVTLTLEVFGKDDAVSAKSGSYNKNIEVTLPTPTNDEYLFRGWFTDEGCQTEVSNENGVYKVTPKADMTVYAKWVKKVTITVHLEDGATLPEGSLGADGPITTFGQTEKVTILRPTKEGSKFGGWFTDPDCTKAWGEMEADGSTTVELEEGDVVAIDLYPKWDAAPAYSGEYKLYYLDGQTANGGVDKADTYNKNVVIDAEGFLAKTSGTAWPFTSYDLHVSGLESGDGEFVFTYSTSGTFKAAYDSATGLITLIARGNDYGDMFLLVPVSIANVTVTNSYWSSGEIRTITVKGDDTECNIFLSGNKAYFGVTFEDKDGKAVAAEEAYHTENRFYVKKGGEAIEGVKGYGYNGTTMVELDGWEGEYTYGGVSGDDFDFGTIEISGTGSVKTDKKGNGTYELVKDKNYTADLRLDNVFYYLTLTLDEDTHTYTVVKPMAKITFVLVDATGGTSITSSNDFPAEGDYNLNTQFTFGSVPKVEGFVFRGWYTVSGNWSDREKLSVDEDGNYIYTPTEMEVTLYARFLKEVTLTLHYGNEMDDVVIKLGAGETVSSITPSPMPADPTVVNQKKFLGWYQDADCNDKWETSYVISENKTVYAKWSETLGDVNYTPDESEETTKWVQEGEGWKSNNYHEGSSTATLEILFTVEGTYSFHWYVSSESARYDYLKIVHKHADGSAQTTVLDATGGYNPAQEGNLTVEVMPGDTLVLTYQKDSGTDNGDDLARISDIVWRKTVYDEFKGTYSGEQEDFIPDGKGNVSWAGRTGTYVVYEGTTLAVTLEATADQPAEYWLVTLNKEDSSYTATKPTVTVNFVTGDETLTVESKEYNINIPVELPVPETETKYVEGWYEDDAYATPVKLDGKGMYTPEGDEPITIYGKVENKLTVTLHYNGHGATPEGTKVLYFKKGETPDLSTATPEDETLFFAGWFNEAECTTAYEPAPLTQNIDIYASWTEQTYSVEIVNNEWTETEGTYRATKKSTNHCNVIAITFKTSGKFTFNWTANFSDSFDGIYVALNNPTPHQANTKELTAYSGSGEKTVDVKAGDVLYIGAYWDSSEDSSSDYATVSNFRFIAG